MSEFADQVAIIVGGANGVGRACAHALARLGVRLVVADAGTGPDGEGRDPEAVQALAQELGTQGAQVLGLPLDVAGPDAASTLVQAAIERFGRVDHGVYCAGFHHDRALLRTGDEELARVLAVHLFAPLRFARELSRSLIAGQHGGSIVLASSASGFFGSAGQSSLAVAAGGLAGFVRTAATELRRHKVRVNVVVPTARTRLTEQLPLFAAIKPDSLSAEHVAQAIVHLLSDAAADVQGEIIGVAGGRIYAFRHAETSGAYLEGNPPSLGDIAGAWRDVTRR
jgi:NAD(P)-dependent dehydrogenase (short-subunit alcohol dehydrogenase family)